MLNKGLTSNTVDSFGLSFVALAKKEGRNLARYNKTPVLAGVTDNGHSSENENIIVC